MRTKAVTRRLALKIPPVRRLFDYAQQQSQQNTQCNEALVASQYDLAQARSEHESVLLSEREAFERRLALDREELDLQLYVMRSDYQRAVVRNETLSASLRECEARAAKSAVEAERRAQTLSEMLATERARAVLSPSDLELVYAKLSGRLTMLSSEVAQLRNTRPGGDGVKFYLDLLERALSGTLVGDSPVSPWSDGYDPEIRAIGRDWPSSAQTMIGAARLRNLRVLVEQALHESVPGDMLEAGVWRGGACILMRGVLAAYDVTDRTIWVADSFSGLPPPEPAYPADTGDLHATYDVLAVPLEEVQANFARYGLLDDQVRFLKGWFADTLPRAPITRIAVLRLDGDMYSSTIQTLDALYNKVSPGGFIIVDDYILPGCRQAIHDFRSQHNIKEPLQDVDGAAMFWRKV